MNNLKEVRSLGEVAPGNKLFISSDAPGFSAAEIVMVYRVVGGGFDVVRWRDAKLGLPTNHTNKTRVATEHVTGILPPFRVGEAVAVMAWSGRAPFWTGTVNDDRPWYKDGYIVRPDAGDTDDACVLEMYLWPASFLNDGAGPVPYPKGEWEGFLVRLRKICEEQYASRRELSALDVRTVPLSQLQAGMYRVANCDLKRRALIAEVTQWIETFGQPTAPGLRVDPSPSQG